MRVQKGRMKKLEKVAGKISDREKISRAIPEVEALMDEAVREYNSPEAKAERERRYEELCEIGRRRREAFARGENPDLVAPLPTTEPESDPECDAVIEELDKITKGGPFNGQIC